MKAILIDFGDTLVEQQVDDVLPASKLDQKAFDDAVPFLTGARKFGYQIAIVSNTSQSDAAEVGRALTGLGMMKFVDKIVTSVDVGHEKPHPAMFLRALELLDCKAHEVVMIGDDPAKDVLGAADLGIATVLLDRKGKGSQNVSPNFLVRSLEEILPMLDADGPLNKQTSQRF